MVLYLIYNIYLKHHFFPVESGIKCFAASCEGVKFYVDV